MQSAQHNKQLTRAPTVRGTAICHVWVGILKKDLSLLWRWQWGGREIKSDDDGTKSIRGKVLIRHRVWTWNISWDIKCGRISNISWSFALGGYRISPASGNSFQFSFLEGEVNVWSTSLPLWGGELRFVQPAGGGKLRFFILLVLLHFSPDVCFLRIYSILLVRHRFLI